MDYPLIFSSVVDVGSNISPEKATGVSCLSWDTEQEILWTGNYSGHITSFVTNPSSYNNLVKYTSFHVDYESDIRQITTCREGVLSLTRNALRLSKRRGLTKFTHKSEHLMKELHCMLYKNLGDSKSSFVYMAGNQEKLIELDIETLKYVRLMNIMEDEKGLKNCFYMKGHPKFICMADCEGKIVLRDADLLKIQHQFNGTAPISSFDVCGNYLVTCSPYSQLLMIYDIREMRLVSATQLYMPSHIKFLSRFTTKCCVVSRNGQFAIVDLTCPNNINQINNINIHSYGAEITSFDVSATDQAFAFGDNHNCVYVHGTCEKFNINTNPIQPEYADAIMPTSYCSLMADYYPPISEICPFPYYAIQKMSDYQRLVSYMPPKQCIRTYRPVPPIAPEMLRSMRVVGNIGYVVNPTGVVPKFANNFANNGNGSRRNSPEGNEFGTDQMPHRYHFLEPNHNKVDKDEYDFSRYNHSPFPGLDSTLPNSYANNMIQCLYFIPQLRAAIISHICNKEYCLVCELGFLFHMLDIAPKHSPCQASNFFRAFRTIPEVAAFKLILPEDESLRKQVNFCKLTQQWIRFLLHQLHRESSTLSTNCYQPTSSKAPLGMETSIDKSRKSFVTDYFSLYMIRQFQCNSCSQVWKTPHISFPVTLNYPINHLNMSPTNGLQNMATEINIESDKHGQKSYVSFIDLLTSSIVTEQTVQVFCSQCDKFQNHVTERRLVSTLPNIFTINTGLDNEMAIKFWQNQINSFTSLSKNRGQNVITNLQKAEKNKQEQQNNNTAKSSNNNSSFSVACRFGEHCNRGDCKYYHVHLDKNNQNKDSYEGNGSFTSWIPLTLYMKSNKDGFVIKDNLNNLSFSDKQGFIEFILVNVTSVVKSDEETFGNIVSAVKIDQSYYDIRRKQMIKKQKRHNLRNAANQTDDNSTSPEYPLESDLSDEEEEISETNEDNDLFTVDSRTFMSNMDKILPVYNSKNEWYLFNHYSINPINIEEVISNDLSWKIPTILMYIKKDMIKSLSNNKNLRRMKNEINDSVFNNDISIAQKIQRNSISFFPLDLKTERLKKGDIVAMDAEFVMLNHEETELRSDGTRTTIKPSHKSVARISVVRGSGSMQGVPFIDDYISTQDQVADYMTKFSGIQPGDLDATLSSKHLTTLKSTYLKLRFLVDNGVIFVGHGLRNDFRVINLVVPPEQVIDTVFLFQSPNSKRMVSLRFLAWHFLNLNIQSETHDSVEDAKTALALYHKYKELEASGRAQKEIEELYKIGKDCGWKISDYQ